MELEVLDIPSRDGLDPITVFWRNYAPGKGEAVITCYDSAWKCYFGGMGDKTIQQFFTQCSSDYLLPKLACTQFLKNNRVHEVYLTRIINAVRSTLREKELAAAA